MARGSKLQIDNHLQLFRAGADINYNKILLIPKAQRIPALASNEEGYKYMVTAFTAAISSMLGKINIKQGMDNAQVVDLAETIIQSSIEDWLAPEDVILFMADLIRGKYGPIYDRFDASVFFEKFEQYRERRHSTLVKHREEENAHFKSLGADAAPRKTGDMDADTFFDLYNTTLNDD